MFTNTLFKKLVLSYVVLMAASLGVFAIIVFGIFSSVSENEAREHLKSTVLMISAKAPLHPADIEQFAATSRARITLVGPDGTVVADSDTDPVAMENHNDRPEVVGARSKGHGENVRFSATVSMDMMYVAVPLDLGEPDGYIVRASMPLSQISVVAGRVLHTVLITLAVTLFLAVLIGYIVIGKTVRPIEAMTAAAEAIAAGDLDGRMAVGADDEVGKLAGTIEKMRLELRGRFSILNAVLSGIREGIVAVDKQYKIVFANASAEKMLGFDQAKAPGRLLWEAVRQDKVIDFVRSSVKTPPAIPMSVDIALSRENVIRAYCIPVKQGTDDELFLVVIHDLSQEAKFERLRKDFVADVSHELRTPLTFIQGYLETLNESGGDEKARKEFIEIIDRNVKQLSALVDDLLELSRLESSESGEELKLRQTDMRGLFERAVARLEPMIRAKGQIVSIETEPQQMQAAVEPDLMEKAVKNLLDNAAKYTQDKGHIELRCAAGPDGVRITVADDGPGIPEQDLPRIFERFYRVDKSRSREMGGTGLGLAIVKHIAQLHGGTVSVDSAPGKGSRFTISIPGQHSAGEGVA